MLTKKNEKTEQRDIYRNKKKYEKYDEQKRGNTFRWQRVMKDRQ